ncbi:MAG: sigma-54-dependent Fis family transcriptional regulator [Deltaproteobacteria bacterium]|nr:sigma-54-dependent Fis family transcriptional regulator [Deltaproteobacteria bacterium]MBW2382701.1 sigma-54-dependent Fis family transcriptional regulator [Deltaproteobacteria bacterium]MBW2696298.1 sigma-54-dependent Fis family transcriptional regulator [Deltaproteobacteria bacterium]
MTARILVVEDENAIRLALKGLLTREGYEVVLAEDGESAIEIQKREVFDLVLTDLALGRGASGMDVLKAAKELRPETAVVMITAHGSEKIAVEAMKAGAEDYVPKPFDNDELRVVVRRALDRHRLERENRLLLEQIQREYGFEKLVGAGKAMQRIFSIMQKVAETDLSVMIRGESGTGKELVAQAIHNTSTRKHKPFVAVNCAAINRELVESELFGHEKGAFTGADSRRTGRFEAADGGTIFLDEIGDMAPETQAKVLRVLEERKLERVGSTRSIDVDVRVISATHRDLEEEVAKGNFREDLYYRLKVVALELPPLRERPEDTPALAERFLDQVAERLGRERKRLSADALARLTTHAWPGNVRELRNVLEQAAVLAPGDEIEESDLQLGMAQPQGLALEVSGDLPFGEAKRRTVESFERDYLLRALREHDGNVSRTAQAIGMVRQSLQQKIRELDLRSEDWSRDSQPTRGGTQ